MNYYLRGDTGQDNSATKKEPVGSFFVLSLVWFKTLFGEILLRVVNSLVSVLLSAQQKLLGELMGHRLWCRTGRIQVH